LFSHPLCLSLSAIVLRPHCKWMLLSSAGYDIHSQRLLGLSGDKSDYTCRTLSALRGTAILTDQDA
jgi:hypothetical protein